MQHDTPNPEQGSAMRGLATLILIAALVRFVWWMIP